MTAPSNANTSGLEVVAWRKNVWVAEGIGTGWMLSNDQPEPHHLPTDIEPLVTAASAQARIDAAEARADRLAKALERIAHPEYGLGFNKLRGIARAALQQETQP